MATRNPWIFDTILPYFDPSPAASPCITEQSKEQKTAYLCEIRNPVQRSATTDRTLVMRLGQQFESARRRFALDYFVATCQAANPQRSSRRGPQRSLNNGNKASCGSSHPT